MDGLKFFISESFIESKIIASIITHGLLTLRYLMVLLLLTGLKVDVLLFHGLLIDFGSQTLHLMSIFNQEGFNLRLSSAILFFAVCESGRINFLL